MKKIKLIDEFYAEPEEDEPIQYWQRRFVGEINRVVKEINEVIDCSNGCKSCGKELEQIQGSWVFVNDKCPMKGVKQIQCCNGETAQNEIHGIDKE